jgi:hypothetical protein
VVLVTFVSSVHNPKIMLGMLVTGCRAERDADLPAPPSRQPRPKRVAEEVELVVGMVSAPIIILAEDDLRLRRMQRQPAVREPLLKGIPQRRGLRLASAMADRIIGIALEWDVGIVPRHPHVERIVEKEIGQEGADDPTLRCPSFSCDAAPVRHLHRCF